MIGAHAVIHALNECASIPAGLAGQGANFGGTASAVLPGRLAHRLLFVRMNSRNDVAFSLTTRFSSGQRRPP